MVTATPAGAGRIPGLDALRAIAVVAVMLYHLAVPGFALGWAGVQLFFVISGFLITGILLDTRANPDYFKSFYIRRTLRIFPIYYLSLAVLLAAGAMVHKDISDGPFYAVYLQNYLLGAGARQTAFPWFFNHTWSLAVEEQFYLAWPLLIFALNRRILLVLLAALPVVAVFVRVHVLRSAPDLVSVFTLFATLPVQVDGLCAGALLAFLHRSGTLQKPRTAAWAATALTVGAALLALVELRLRGWNPAIRGDAWSVLPKALELSALAWVFVASIALILIRPAAAACVLEVKGLRHVGRISYGLYLYHYPVFWLVDPIAQRLPWFGDGAFPYAATVMVKLLVTFAVAELSWRVIERPLLQLKDRWAARAPRAVPIAAPARVH